MTNEQTKPADEMKDVAAGAIPDQTSTTAERRPHTNDPGKTLDTSALNTAAAGARADMTGTTGGDVADPPDTRQLVDDVGRHEA